MFRKSLPARALTAVVVVALPLSALGGGASVAAEEEPLQVGDVADPTAAPPEEAAEEAVFAEESDSGLWIVKFDEPAVAAYAAMDQPAGAASPEAYAAQIERTQERAFASIDADLGRDVEVAGTYVQVLNGASLRVDRTEAARIAELPGVDFVVPDNELELLTDVSHELINSEAVWEGDTVPQLPTRGEGVITAMLDSGINPEHPAFAAEDGEGYVHENPLGEGNYLGVCDPENETYDSTFPCNAKLIGAYDMVSGTDARDEDGHGSHVGSTMAGNKHTATFDFRDSEFTREVSGVAPRATIVSFKICGPAGCFPTSSLEAIEEAVIQEIDVINYSVSGSDEPWSDAVSMAYLDATAAGVTVVAATGNDGPLPETTNHASPWITAVGATTTDRVFAHPMSITSPTPPERLVEFAGVAGEGTYLTGDVEVPIVDAALVSAGNGEGCNAFAPGSLEGAWVLIERGDLCTFADKLRNAEDAGAEGALWYHEYAGPPLPVTGLGAMDIPSLWISEPDARALKGLLAEQDVTVAIAGEGETMFLDGMADIVGEFSSRGPSQYDLQVPTVAAPGVNILAATLASADSPVTYDILRGTSMASPHTAGSAALLVSLYPDLDPSGIRSLLATSADPEGLVKEDYAAATSLEVGSGRVDLAQAGRVGVVLTETAENFAAADPGDGGDPRALNVPNYVNSSCAFACDFTRTVTSISDAPATYTVAVENGDGMDLRVTPAEFTLQPGASQAIAVTVDVGAGYLGEWTFGRLTLETTDEAGNGEALASPSLPVTVIPTDDYAETFPPNVESAPESLVAEQDTGTTSTHEVSIGNTGEYPLDWTFADVGREDTADLVDQPVEGTRMVASGYYTFDDAGAYAADDITFEEPVLLDNLRIPGSWTTHAFDTLITADALDWAIYTDDDGVPGDVVWEFSGKPTTGGVLLEENTVTLNIARVADGPLALEAGTYWVSFWPTTLTPLSRWNWLQGASEDQDAMFLDPDNLFNVSATDWTPVGEFLPGFTGLAFTARGSSAEFACGADWVQPASTGGRVPFGDTETVEVVIDTAGLNPGSYSTQLCLDTNDPDRGLTRIPVTLTVTGEPVAPQVERIYGDDRYGTAAEVSALFPDGVETVYLANAEDWAQGADALTAGAAAAGDVVAGSPEGAPLLLVQQDRIPADTLAALTALDPANAVVLGGTSVIDGGVAEDLTGLGIEVTRIDGSDRYDTAAKLSGYFAASEPGTVYVALGEAASADTALADALAAASVAGSQDAPVLLTRSGHLPRASAEAITALAPERIVLVGGESAITSEVEEALDAIAPTERVEGHDRYATAAALVEGYAPDGSMLYTASGLDFPDALAVSPLSGSQDAPLLLVNAGVPKATRDAVLALSPQGISVLGGDSIVTDPLLAALQALLDQTSTD